MSDMKKKITTENLAYFWQRIRGLIPTKNSQLTNDSGYLTNNNVFTGATSSTAGTSGVVPFPQTGDESKYLQGDGTWDTPAARHGTGTSAAVEGYSTTASGVAAHAEGYSTTASGVYSHAEGGLTTAISYYSHAEGHGTIAQGKAQHVFGEYNVQDEGTTSSADRGTYVEIVGNGDSSSARSNARTLDWDGNETLAGKIIADGSELTNLDASQLTLNTVPIARLPIDQLFPVGSYYTATSTGEADPAALFGGTWEKVVSTNNSDLVLAKRCTISLTSAGWSNNNQTVTCNGVTANNTVICTPAPADVVAWSTAFGRCSAQANNSLTFTVSSTTPAVTINVLILDNVSDASSIEIWKRLE